MVGGTASDALGCDGGGFVVAIRADPRREEDIWRGWLIVSAFSVFAALSLAACGSGGTKTVTVTTTERAGATGSTESSESAPSDSVPKVQRFHGTGQKNLGAITVPPNATVSWECASCKNTNFIINNAESDPNLFPTNGLDQTQGVEPLAEGVYHTVVVSTEAGPWVVKIEGE